jgi:ParB family chromosome partitioning protein
MSKRSSNATFDLKGRGVLGGLVSEPAATKETVSDAAIWIPVSKIKPNPLQPRQYFAEESIDSLVQSFQEQGFRGALNVRSLGSGVYELVAGERRLRAAKKARLKEVRCIVEAYSDEEALEFALVENLQREDLSKLEETEGILKLIETKLGISQDDAISVIRTEGHPDKLGRSDVAPSENIQNIGALLSHFNIELQTFRTKNLRTLTLPQELKDAHLKEGLAYSCALELNKVKDKEARKVLLEEALKAKLSFRDIKQRVKALSLAKAGEPPSETGPSIIEQLEVSVKRAKKAKHLFATAQKRKQLERILRDLEALLEEE